MSGETFVLPDGRRLIGVHPASACAGRPCVIHHPSEHHMRDWPLVWRGDGPMDTWRGFERKCPHGIGHPDPDDLAYRRDVLGEEYAGIHGCDGCCGVPK